MASLKTSKAWKELSKHTRYRDKGICYTCLVQHDPREMDAGHFFHRSSMMFFNTIFVRCQCVRCNRFLHGNLGIYARRLTEEIGLKELKRAEVESVKYKKWSPKELKAIEIKYMSKEIQTDDKLIKEKKRKLCPHKMVAYYCGSCMPRKKSKIDKKKEG